jgi:mRNA guanylyltransferase
MHLNFEERLYHLKRASFRTPAANRDMFDEKDISNRHIPLPLVRKNFVPRTEIDYMCNFVSEELGMRIYSNGTAHNHLTDGIIFQPNTPYVCGTDIKLLKWKYLDTVTIDVELMPPQHDDDEHVLRTACLGELESDTRIDLTRFVKLPLSERLRMEADRHVARLEGYHARIAEVGLDPETGEWYYVMFRNDKDKPNHIKTVLGSSMELAEHVTTEELRYRMSIPEGARDVFPRDLRFMMTQLLQHQRKRNDTFREELGKSTTG